MKVQSYSIVGLISGLSTQTLILQMFRNTKTLYRNYNNSSVKALVFPTFVLKY